MVVSNLMHTDKVKDERPDCAKLDELTIWSICFHNSLFSHLKARDFQNPVLENKGKGQEKQSVPPETFFKFTHTNSHQSDHRLNYSSVSQNWTICFKDKSQLDRKFKDERKDSSLRQ